MAYGTWVSQAPGPACGSPPLPAGQAGAQTQLRLLCAPPAGMGGWTCFGGWTEGSLPEGVEVMPLELPGRGLRMNEELPYALSLADLARQALDGVGLEVLRQRPFVLFGHSFGAWLVFEMCQELQRRSTSGWPLPLKVYVSACRAPQLAGAAHDPDRDHPTIGNLAGCAFWAAFEKRYGRNPDLQAPYIREFVAPTLQADFRLLEAYEPSCLEPLAVPLCALCASGDARCRPVQLSAWAAVAGPTMFHERWFDVLRPGWATEHRYVIDEPRSVLRFLSSDLPLVGCKVQGEAGVDGPLGGAGEEVGMPAGSRAVAEELVERQRGRDPDPNCKLL